ncbi:MAG: tetratricopeptide repeat protein [Desulfomicrobiaceae bacterium]
MNRMPASQEARLLEAAVTAHRKGRRAKAERLYRAILAINPTHPDAQHNLGQLARQRGTPRDALQHLKTALEARPDVAQYWISFIAALVECGELDAAEKVLIQGQDRGLSGDAVEELQARIQEQRDAALISAEQCCRQNPEIVDSWRHLAELRYAHNDISGSIEALRNCIRLDPENISYRIILADYLDKSGNVEQAAQILQEATAIDPDSFVAWNNYGNMLRKLMCLDQAKDAFARAHTINPKHEVPLINLACLANDQYDIGAALEYAQKAFALAPESPKVLQLLGISLSNVDRCEDAAAIFEKLLAVADTLENRFRYWLLLPWVFQSRAEIDRWRQRFAQGIAELMRSTGTLDGESVVGDYFRLPYQGQDDRPLMEALCRVFRAKAPQINVTAPHCRRWRMPRGRRIRLGICSHGLCNHPVAKFTSGFIREIDRSRFEVFVIHTPQTKHDPLRAKINTWADQVVDLPPGYSHQVERMAAVALDALFLPNVTEEKNLYLGCARLAPVQFTSWGIASTSGIDTLDYYISSHVIEPCDAIHHYTERLILLDHLPAYFAFIVAPDSIPDRSYWQIDDHRPLYFCPQNLFKYHPDFDKVLEEIAKRDHNAQFVFIEGMSEQWTDRLRSRWQCTAPILNSKARFLPRQAHNDYMGLVARSDVILDTVHFGSGTTFYEAMYYGTPVVTWPGRFMRGRIVAGGYQQMGLIDVPVANSLEEYAEVAVAWANDPHRRQRFRQAALAAREKLFADALIVRQLEEFLLAALDAADRGEKLPSGWRAGFSK